MTGLGAVALFASYPFLAIYRGVVLTLLWGWFVIPVFGLPSLGIVQAIGISLVAGFLTYQREPQDDKGAGYLIAWSLVMTTTVLAFGFIWHLFLPK